MVSVRKCAAGYICLMENIRLQEYFKDNTAKKDGEQIKNGGIAQSSVTDD